MLTTAWGRMGLGMFRMKSLLGQLRTRARGVALAMSAGVLALAAPLHAGNIVHFQPAAGPHNYIVTNHPAVLEHLKLSGWLLGSYAYEPLVERDADGNPLRRVVAHAATADATLALGLFDRFEIGIGLPVAYLNGDGFDDANRLNAAAIGDVRLMGKVLLTPWNEGVVASFRLKADMPLAQFTGTGGSFTGDDELPNITPAFSVGYNSDVFRVGADVGYLIRKPSSIGAGANKLNIGHEFIYGAGAEFTMMPKTLFGTVDLFGRAAPKAINEAIIGSTDGETTDMVPLELAAGLKYYTGPILVTGGLGTGLVADYGAPRFRVFAGVGYYPRSAEDRDGDGILDADDECPDEPETVNGYLDMDGCPDERTKDGDRDGDGIADSRDDCPDAPEDKDGFEDSDGCPDVDNDKDGILDRDDECRDEPEDRDRWKDSDGCPDPDNDNDKILDEDDECPNDPEVYNDNEDEDGCPDGKKVKVVLKRDKIEILEKVYFAYDSARILPKSYDLLDSVAQVIADHPELERVRVEGHTDADGSERYNLQLSKKRAKAVAEYLVDAGVEAERLESEGYGESQPIADNRSESGKAKNRRVEFKIVGEEGGEIRSTDDADANDAAPEPERDADDTDDGSDVGDTWSDDGWDD